MDCAAILTSIGGCISGPVDGIGAMGYTKDDALSRAIAKAAEQAGWSPSSTDLNRKAILRVAALYTATRTLRQEGKRDPDWILIDRKARRLRGPFSTSVLRKPRFFKWLSKRAPWTAPRIRNGQMRIVQKDIRNEAKNLEEVGSPPDSVRIVVSTQNVVQNMHVTDPSEAGRELIRGDHAGKGVDVVKHRS
ncbi:hypothetical protein DFJ74DRAFT_293053 [Hyaloraphidium curvatum]|nr:hypothetical protein DFJ74DRAFT_293053 [Hyaloraphidium curvatum]